MGAKVVAAASSQEKIDLAIKHGASAGGWYTRPAASTKSLRNPYRTNSNKHAVKAGADVIYDAVGGDYAEAALRAIAWKGRFLVVGFPAGIPSIPLNLALLKGCQIVGVFWGLVRRARTG